MEQGSASQLYRGASREPVSTSLARACYRCALTSPARNGGSANVSSQPPPSALNNCTKSSATLAGAPWAEKSLEGIEIRAIIRTVSRIIFAGPPLGRPRGRRRLLPGNRRCSDEHRAARVTLGRTDPYRSGPWFAIQRPRDLRGRTAEDLVSHLGLCRP